MARSANSANIKRDQEGPDYKGVVDIVRGQLRNNDADQKSLAQDNATLFTRIEKQHGVHKGAAKTFQSIDRMSPDKRTDYLRSLLGLLGVAGYDNFDDLVDRAQKSPGKTGEKAAEKGSTGKGAKAKAPDALDGAPTVQRTNLKTGWLQRPKADADLAGELTDEDWEDIREATADEMAAERERIADFPPDEKPGNVHPFPVGKA